MANDIIIRGSQILFRKTKMEDLDYVIETENHPDNRRFITQWSRQKHIDTISEENHLHIIIEDNQERTAGYMIISGLLNPHECIELTRLTISSKGLGCGKEAIDLAQKYAFEYLHAHRLWLDVVDTNLRAKHIYESAGFKVEGLLRECLKAGGGYESLFIMGILRREYEARTI